MSKVLRVSLWNPIKKSVICKSLTVKEGDDEEECKKRLIEWRENMKKELKKQKARNILNESIDDYDDDDDDDEIDDKYAVRPFNYKDIDVDTTGVIILSIGSMRSGKTYTMKKIYENVFKNKDFITILYANNLQAPIYQDIDNDVIKTFEFIPQLPKIQKKIQKETKSRYKFLNILDDEVDNATRNSETLKKMLVSYRNSMISSYVLVQAPTLLSKIGRSNGHFILFHRLNSEEMIEDMIKKYLNNFLGGRGVKMAEKIKKYQELTKNHQFIMLDNINDKITVNKI